MVLFSLLGFVDSVQRQTSSQYQMFLLFYHNVENMEIFFIRDRMAWKHAVVYRPAEGRETVRITETTGAATTDKTTLICGYIRAIILLSVNLCFQKGNSGNELFSQRMESVFFSFVTK